ncbi:MAG: hypothetical protein DMF96_01115 [Acidobacteria bacterium]|nr:MAG: hypothetical protein DMF96_01115 [Acidobacteriota bacterium]
MAFGPLRTGIAGFVGLSEPTQRIMQTVSAGTRLIVAFAGPLVLDLTMTVTYFVTAIGAPFQTDDDIFGHGDTKTQRRTRFR